MSKKINEPINQKIKGLLNNRIMYIDGAMGTMIQSHKLTEVDFRGERFKNHSKDIKGNNDILCLTRPDIIKQIHLDYFLAGADIVETNTFNANSISQADYALESVVFELNKKAAEIAKEAAHEFMGNNSEDAQKQMPKTKPKPKRNCFVAGAIGPTSKTLSLSPDVDNPGYRAVSFDEMKLSYQTQIDGLIAGGVDLLLIETIFDTLNAKAALLAAEEIFVARGIRLPIIISVTITDLSGRTLSGQTLEAFWYSIRYAKPLLIGINCALGAREMRPYIEQLSRIADTFVCCYPNAGLPNPLAPTGYNETPEMMSEVLREFAESGIVNMLGGCCGTTPDHIRAIISATKSIAPRKVPDRRELSVYCGLEAFKLENSYSPFVMIGERTNVTGSPKFAELIRAKDLSSALSIARNQVENGANIIDVNFDEGLLDSENLMSQFLKLMASEPDIARIPIMIDSSKWSVLVAGLKSTQGKCIVNSLSLKEGEAKFLEMARQAQLLGAAIVVMAFDEKGQATTIKDKVSICERAYKLLIERLDFDPHDIIFDPNVLTIGTGIAEHDNYAINFIEAIREIKKCCPGARTSGGVSNLSFSFRGQNNLREALHTVFLFHAARAGLDMGIVNARQLAIYEEIPPDLCERAEDLVLNRRADATERFLEFAKTLQKSSDTKKYADEWRKLSVNEKLSHALVHGVMDYIDEDTAEALEKYKQPIAVIEGPLMSGMKTVGELFGSGKMFLPQVVKSARVMKKSVAFLEPHMQEKSTQKTTQSRGKFLIATVKGDVHDIGKNIVSVVLSCNNYEVYDLGVMTSCEQILKKAKEIGADIIGLSGLITPSLEEMIYIVQEMEREKFNIPILIGGATTSSLHTAVKIAPYYSHIVEHVLDASLVINVCNHLLDKDKRSLYAESLKEKQKNLLQQFKSPDRKLTEINEARAQKPKINHIQNEIATPEFLGVKEFQKITVDELEPYIDWSPFFWVWGLKGLFPKIFENERYGKEAKKIYEDAQILLAHIKKELIFSPKAAIGLWPANSVGDDIEIYESDSRQSILGKFHFLRQQVKPFYSLADFVAPKNSGVKDYVGGFVVTAGFAVDKLAQKYKDAGDDYSAIIVKALGDRLAEAMAEMMHKKVREICGYGRHENLTYEELIKEKYRGIRPAPGYPACPEHSEKRILFKLLNAEKTMQVSLTENFAIKPASSVCGFYFIHPEAKYFAIQRISDNQLIDYATRKGLTLKEARRLMGSLLYND